MHANGQKCTECTDRGVECVSQDSRPAKHPRAESKLDLQKRIGTLENAVQSILGRIDADGKIREVSWRLLRITYAYAAT